MVTILKIIFALLVLGGLGVVAYAYLGDLSPEQIRVIAPVALDEG